MWTLYVVVGSLLAYPIQIDGYPNYDKCEEAAADAKDKLDDWFSGTNVRTWCTKDPWKE